MSLFVLNALFDVTHAVLQAAPEVTPASNPDGSPAGSPGIGGFFAIPTEDVKKVWPWEDYTLIASRVPVGLPECCLADGLDYKAAG